MKAKLTITVDEELVPVAKEYARSQGKSLSQLIEDALRHLSDTRGPSFSEQWTGSLQPAERTDARFRKLAGKYL